MEFVELLRPRTVRAHNEQKTKKIKPRDDSLLLLLGYPQKGLLVVNLIACMRSGNCIGQMGGPLNDELT